ncbi:manganese catalase family protein [Halosimplex aquaticum]|uniref:Manganese catalase family protein n=1 Tax=Halosimplex aquaticum TaxID=3026162 RepID=A0ABD5XXF5_9EURY|nr:manganese catalase family protein [Halosimplex aquaticum]
MFYHDNELQYEVEVEEPDPQFAKMLQEGIGGIEGEMRVALQYMFQAFGTPKSKAKYRNMLMSTAMEEFGHIEMYATAISKNLEGAPQSIIDEIADGNPLISMMMESGQPRQALSAGLHGLATDANGVPFNGNYVIASGNLAADMYANIAAEATGRLLATRLYEMTDDEGMKDMLAYLIARDTMHQNQWHAVLEELGETLPVPASFPQEKEHEEYSYQFMSTFREQREDPQERWTQGTSIDGEGEFSYGFQPGGGTAIVEEVIEEMHNEATKAGGANDDESIDDQSESS